MRQIFFVSRDAGFGCRLELHALSVLNNSIVFIKLTHTSFLQSQLVCRLLEVMKSVCECFIPGHIAERLWLWLDVGSLVPWEELIHMSLWFPKFFFLHWTEPINEMFWSIVSTMCLAMEQGGRLLEMAQLSLGEHRALDSSSLYLGWLPAVCSFYGCGRVDQLMIPPLPGSIGHSVTERRQTQGRKRTWDSGRWTEMEGIVWEEKRGSRPISVACDLRAQCFTGQRLLRKGRRQWSLDPLR